LISIRSADKQIEQRSDDQGEEQVPHKGVNQDAPTIQYHLGHAIGFTQVGYEPVEDSLIAAADLELLPATTETLQVIPAISATSWDLVDPDPHRNALARRTQVNTGSTFGRTCVLLPRSQR